MQGEKEKIEQLLSRNVEGVIEKEHLRAALLSGKKLRVKFGIDPTGKNIHIGRAVVLWKLREFQELGHTIVLIIGDFTAQIGDPSDKLEKRPFLSKEQVVENFHHYMDQIRKILDIKNLEVHYNSEWLAKLTFREISELAELFTFQQILERRNFRERWEKHEEISYREGMYPLMQGYDSVAVKADVELGGTDQLFNLLAGRKLQERYDQKPQDILTTKMIVGLDGRKMSTSWGNVINISDPADEQFGKIMSLRDELIGEYFELVTDLPMEEVEGLKNKLSVEAKFLGIKISKGKKENPKLMKEKLAFEVVKRYHGEKAAHEAKENFEKLFSKKEMPADIPELKIAQKNISVLDLVMATGALKSKSEARRLIEQGGFEIGGEANKNPQDILSLHGKEVIRVGKKRFFRLKSE